MTMDHESSHEKFVVFVVYFEKSMGCKPLDFTKPYINLRDLATWIGLAMDMFDWVNLIQCVEQRKQHGEFNG